MTRVCDLAKELSMKSTDLLNIIKELGYKAIAETINDVDLGKVKDFVKFKTAAVIAKSTEEDAIVFGIRKNAQGKYELLSGKIQKEIVDQLMKVEGQANSYPGAKIEIMKVVSKIL